MRPTEVKAVAELLEHEAESTTELAKAIIKRLDVMRKDYDRWSVNIHLAGVKHSMGPFDTENQAVGAVMGMLGTLNREDAEPYITRMINPRMLEAPEVKVQLKTWCVECKHPMVAHNWPSAKVPRGCMVGYVAGQRDSGCQCGR